MSAWSFRNNSRYKAFLSNDGGTGREHPCSNEVNFEDSKIQFLQDCQGGSLQNSSSEQVYCTRGTRSFQTFPSKNQPTKGRLRLLLSRREEASSFPSTLDLVWIRIPDQFRPFPDFTGCPDWAKPMMFAWHQGGVSERLLCSIFGNLTENLAVAIRGAVYSTMILSKFSHIFIAQRNRPNCIPQSSPAIIMPEVETRTSTVSPWLQAQTSIDHFELDVFERASHGVCRETFEPSSFRRTEYYANPQLCTVAGLSQEDYLLGVQHANLAQHMSELDMLCMMMEDLLHFGDTKSSSIVRWGWPGRPAVLMERSVERLFDRHGQYWQRVIHFRPISPSQYDLSTSPAQQVRSRSSTRSMQQAIGDDRSGSQLLADAARDRDEHTLAALAAGPAGRGVLSRMAEEVLRLFDDKTREARRILVECPEVELWAREWVARPWLPGENEVQSRLTAMDW